MSQDYIRRCPSCAAENALGVMRCACGALLTGVDLEAKGQEAPAAVPAARVKAGASLVCPHEDCAQANPPGTVDCLYCNRPLAGAASQAVGLFRLPAVLAERYRIVRAYPAAGAEAELFLVVPLAGGAERVAKIYRRGLFPKEIVRERVARIPERHRIGMLEGGTAEGHAYEVMEYCPEGSLRDLAHGAPLSRELLLAAIRELAGAIAAVHGLSLVHRDLKPDNVLVRARAPLQLVLTDFGITSVLDATQRFTGTAKTLHYAAPETLSGILDGKTDYWALGMLILELALGKHPFAGLSDAVILHHLTTRGVELSGIEDPSLRKLLRGLLLRDPKARWGQPELARWLARDETLPEPADQEPGGFRAPYRVHGELCRNPEQLAIALSRHWALGVTDIVNGQLLAWFREVQKDQDTVRLLLEMLHERALHVDVQLLRLLLHLAPGLPPVWRGESIELPAILARASLALKGDEEAAFWLDALYQHRVLEAYAAAGNEAIAEVVRRWNQAGDGFAAAWESLAARLKANMPPPEVALYDDVVYGRSGPVPPPLSSLHPRLLAMAFDPNWAEYTRRRLKAEIAGLLAYCPGLIEPDAITTLPTEQLLALEALLPEARKAADRHRSAEQKQVADEAARRRQAENELRQAISALQRAAGSPDLGEEAHEELSRALGAFFAQLAQLRASDPSASSETLAAARRLEPHARRLDVLMGQMEQHLAINRGWLSFRVLGFFTLTLAILPRIVGDWLIYTLLGSAAVLLIWRLLPVHLMRKNLRRSLRQLSQFK